MIHLCEDFYWGRANLERINWACITLIPKVPAPGVLSYFRPISLINTFVKIISKILAIRLDRHIGDLVEPSQSAFIRGRCIFDNVVTAEELFFSLQKRKIVVNALKLDFVN